MMGKPRFELGLRAISIAPAKPWVSSSANQITPLPLDLKLIFAEILFFRLIVF